jgi:hypothetical protein
MLVFSTREKDSSAKWDLFSIWVINSLCIYVYTYEGKKDQIISIPFPHLSHDLSCLPNPLVLFIITNIN